MASFMQVSLSTTSFTETAFTNGSLERNTGANGIVGKCRARGPTNLEMAHHIRAITKTTRKKDMAFSRLQTDGNTWATGLTGFKMAREFLLTSRAICTKVFGKKVNFWNGHNCSKTH